MPLERDAILRAASGRRRHGHGLRQGPARTPARARAGGSPRFGSPPPSGTRPCARSSSARSGGTSSRHRVGCTYGQRVWKRHPSAGSPGSAGRRWSRIGSRCRSTTGSGIGTAESSEIVYGCSGFVVELVRRRDLDDRAEIHDGDPVGDVPDDREVVRDEEIGELEVVLQRLEQVEDLRLDRHVERRDRLVGDDEVRVDGERARDADSLALAARELVRIARRRVRGQPDDARAARGRASARRAATRDRARATARRRSARRCAAGSATRTDPGRPSASAGAAGAARPRPRCVMSWPSKTMRPAVGS